MKEADKALVFALSWISNVPYLFSLFIGKPMYLIVGSCFLYPFAVMLLLLVEKKAEIERRDTA